jgi:hypothetical protein
LKTDLTNTARILALKMRARHFYSTYRQLTAGVDCGRALAEEIMPTARAAKQGFNETMDELAKIDPTTPKERL